ncbi:hypothetical protein L1887_07561 [Cichorium endivia]|nr:hypothetical protein L1887_07561 [Cichorium endivia]
MGGVDESEKYLLNRHKENHFTAGEIVRDIIIGVSDGLTVPFSLAAGLSGANASSSIILNAGIAEVAAGAISMGLGGGSDTTKHAFVTFKDRFCCFVADFESGWRPSPPSPPFLRATAYTITAIQLPTSHHHKN